MIKSRIILTDFFDTIMHREVHPLQVTSQWCKVMSQKIGIDVARLQCAVKKACKDDYMSYYGAIYDNLLVDNVIPLSKSSFIDIALDIETAIEIGCQYPCKSHLKRLRRWKKQGRKIYIVSDFHLPRNSFEIFLKAKNIEIDLFDDIFISGDCNCSKNKDGELYRYVLDKIGVTADEVVMIGDNRFADGVMAKKCGIQSKIYSHRLQWISYQFKKRFNYTYSKIAYKKIINNCYKFNSPYIEYALPFYYSTKKLYASLKLNNIPLVSFLAREGYFMKRAFDIYQSIVIPCNQSVETLYIKCSRRAAQSTSEERLHDLLRTKISLKDYLFSYGFSEKEIEDIFINYGVEENELYFYDEVVLEQNSIYKKLISIPSFVKMLNDKIYNSIKAAHIYFIQTAKYNKPCVVDIGWRGYMQNTIGGFLEQPIYGYYLGLNKANIGIDDKEGLLFEYCPQYNRYSKYSDILKSNIQLYEQLSAAPHGSALGYTIAKDKSVLVHEDWAENERALYEDIIEKTQEEMLLVMEGLMAWCEDVENDIMLKECAKTILHSALLANRERLDFLKSLDNGFIWNFNSQKKGLDYNVKEVKMGMDILYAPERYTRYFAKIQRILDKRFRCFSMMYLPLGWLIYRYIWLCVRLKK